MSEYIPFVAFLKGRAESWDLCLDPAFSLSISSFKGILITFDAYAFQDLRANKCSSFLCELQDTVSSILINEKNMTTLDIPTNPKELFKYCRFRVLNIDGTDENFLFELLREMQETRKDTEEKYEKTAISDEACNIAEFLCSIENNVVVANANEEMGEDLVKTLEKAKARCTNILYEDDK